MGSLLEFAKEASKLFKGEDIVFDPRREIEYISSGCLQFDLIGRGGFPKGRISEVFGLESSGKTSLALATISAMLSRSSTDSCVFWDFEQTWSGEYAQDTYGIPSDTDRLILLQPMDIESGDKLFELLEKHDPVQLMVFDSVAAMEPKDRFDKSLDDPSKVGLHAQLFGRFLNKIRRYIKRTGCTVIFLNQMRGNIKANKYDQKPGMGAGFDAKGQWTTTGGNALKYYASARYRISHGSKIEANEDLPDGRNDGTKVGNIVNIDNVKNKTAAPYYRTKATFRFALPGHKGGWDNGSDLLVNLKNLGAVNQAGRKFTYRGLEREWENVGTKEDSVRYFLSNPDLTQDAFALLMQKARQIKDDASLGKALGITHALVGGNTDPDLDEEIKEDMENIVMRDLDLEPPMTLNGETTMVK